MATGKEIKRRQESIRNIYQITKAMKLVSTVRLQKVRGRVEKQKSYTRALLAMMKDLLQEINDKEEQKKKKMVVFLTSNRGLAGGYHLKMVSRLKEANFIPENTQLYVIGTKGREALKANGYLIKQDYSEIWNTWEEKDIKNLAEDLVKDFFTQKSDSIFCVYMEFYHPIKQVVQLQEVLPEKSKRLAKYAEEFEVLENQEIEAFFVDYLQEILSGILLEGIASEQGARLAAMDQASENAEELLEELSLNYHRTRQKNITQELTELIGSIGGIV